MSRYKKNLGAYGEDLACQFLLRHGYTIIARNFFCKYGELDIVAMHPSNSEIICCIEVKTRLSHEYGSPEEAVTGDKIKKLHDTTCSFFSHHKIKEKHFRLDIISIFIDTLAKKARIKHLKALGEEDFNQKSWYW